ncbi:MAG TPA: YidB family protein [Methylocella sp.]|nr:YidB family protein [Methylocella sp.]
MGLFDGILGGIIGVEGATLLNNFVEKQGGLQNIASQFEKNGFGETMKSWVSLGPNSPITADQIRQALGSEKVKEMATKLGLPVDKLTDLLAQHLPQVIDKATPDGKLPS